MGQEMGRKGTGNGAGNGAGNRAGNRAGNEAEIITVIRYYFLLLYSWLRLTDTNPD